MGWFDKATAAAKLGASAAKNVASGIADGLEAELGKEHWYKDGQVLVGEAFRGANAFMKEGVGELGKTELGAVVGEVVRSGGKALSSLPLGSLATDTAKARHGIAELRCALQQDPKDPVSAIWLSEAIGRVRADLVIYSRIRSVTSPTYALLRESVRAASQLGADAGDPIQTRLLKLAFANSVTRLKRNRADATAHDVLARVYLATNKYAQAVRFAKLGILADPSCSLQWVTLSRAYLALGRTSDAEKAARRAIRSGAGYGSEILADITLLEQNSAGLDGITKYDRLRSLVTPEHRRAYLGTSVSATSAFEVVARQQIDKLSNILG